MIYLLSFMSTSDTQPGSDEFSLSTRQNLSYRRLGLIEAAVLMAVIHNYDDAATVYHYLNLAELKLKTIADFRNQTVLCSRGRKS